MQFEEFDTKIREAAENHHPAYDEKAWVGMEKLLNKHLPQEKDDRRRIIFFLLLFLVLGGGSFWLISSKPWKGNRQPATAKTTVQQPTGNIATPVSSNTGNPGLENNTLNKEGVTDVNVQDDDKKTTNPPSPDQIPALMNPVNKRARQYTTPVVTGFNERKLKTDQPVRSMDNKLNLFGNKIDKNRMDKDLVDVPTANPAGSTLISDQKKKEDDVAGGTDQTTITNNTKPVVNDPPSKENSNKDNTSLVQNSPEKKEKIKNKKRNSFFFSLSTGPDVSATGSDQLGKTKLLAGGGLGYTFKDKFTIRSGFYTARKIYTSSPGSYHPPANFWNYYPYLEKVDADCKVYEIPLSLSYNFGHSYKQNWFVSGGLSSYLMKKETYKYYYKYTPGGQTLTRQYTPRDKNNNYFSVLNLSGGYQKNIGKYFSVMVEPYLKLPLSGVGLGKVKLNSGGILFSVTIKPFAGSGKHSDLPH